MLKSEAIDILVADAIKLIKLGQIKPKGESNEEWLTQFRFELQTAVPVDIVIESAKVIQANNSVNTSTTIH